MFDYWKCCQKDIINKMMAGFNAKDCYIREDEKIAIPIRDAYTSPWIHARLATDRKCNRYQMIYHAVFGFVPSKCMECWKVVLRPRNLSELFDIYAYQRELRIPSKAGMETRPFVHGNYGAYWYTNSQEEGLDLKDLIHKDFEKTPIILKRGCTEFEMSHGPSDRWEQPKHIQELEELLEDLLVDVAYNDGRTEKIEDGKPSPWYVNEHVKRRWVEFAYDRGDITYKLYTHGKPLMAPVVTYERPLQNGCQVTKLIELAKN
jgi:hypothetical protein